jgi:hypothetical protein
MATAKDFPITQGYGYDPSYPLNGGYHKGIDYGCPTGTPVVVNGVQIGISNATGAVTGPHLHVGRWVNGAATNPGVGGGFSFNSAVVTETGYDATDGNYVRIQGDGASWVYLHLQKVLVSKGQELKKGDYMGFWNSTIENQEEERQIFLAWLGRNPASQEVGRYVGKKVSDVWPDIARNQTRTTVDPVLAYVRDHNGQLPADTDASTKLAEIKKLVG